MDGAQIGDWKMKRIEHLREERKRIDDQIYLLWCEVLNGE